MNLYQAEQSSFNKTITIDYDAGLSSTKITFSDGKDNNYSVGYDLYGITLDRNGKSIFKGHPYLECYFYDLLANKTDFTQKIADVLDFENLGTIKICSESKKDQYIIREIIFNDETYAFIQYKRRFFRPPSQYIVNIVTSSPKAIDIALFGFSYIHNQIAGRNSS